MNSIAVHASQLVSVWLVATLVTSLLSAALYPLFRRAISGHDPSTRSLMTLGYALVGPATGIVTALVSTSPDVARLLIIEHCHAGVCDSHAPLVGGGSPGGTGLVALASLGVLLVASAVIRAVVYGSRRLRSLFALSRQSREREHLVVDSDRLFAWCCGLFRQRIVLSRGLVERLGNAELDVVLAHERAHLARFDNLRNFTCRWATIVWPGASGNRIRSDLEADSEHACDIAALNACRSRQLFRRVVERMTPIRPSPAHGATFGCADTGARMAQLSQIGAGHPPVTAYALLAAIWMTQVATATVLSHPVVEAIAAIGG
jgi:hypothetical protein